MLLKKAFLLTLFGLFLTLPVSSDNISLSKEGPTDPTQQHGSPHSPLSTTVHADYENGVVKATIGKYKGNLQILVYNENNEAVADTQSMIKGFGKANLDVSYLKQGNYTLRIVLDKATYVGFFEI